ncbi:cytoplasmic protein [Aneurinibacillus migulanus]|uniref:DUF4180 domain-containing protein n=1 Tax=Aneurinibacillus migulanus TaxID=47500 RepID=UPI0005BC3F5F|nr:DUF4180 domain-containing protein [Aneurinibacillus migulanus]KIV50618.1 cytoplasmic protein [Aneurinibacillus migulanus]KPD08760.1 cytoplasmic protein [Aneurinibacillus migulanus]CEH31913.1 Uncharacterized protein BN1090_A2_04422 [Aneurinibacillus migulanus]
MNITIDQKNDSKVAIIEGSEILIRNVQDALDLMASVNYNYECNKIMIYQSNLTEEFFELRTRLAGEILQKYVNYHIKLAIVGNFDKYNSKSLKDFIYECNNGKQFFFFEDKQDALQALHSVN